MSRDPARGPMPWDTSDNAGFTAPGVTPWLPLGDTADVATQLDDPRSMLTLTRRLLALRRRTPALSVGSYTPVDGPAGCYVFVRSHDDDRVVVALNFADREVPLDVVASATVLVSTGSDRGDGDMGRRLVLAAYEGCVLRPSG